MCLMIRVPITSSIIIDSLIKSIFLFWKILKIKNARAGNSDNDGVTSEDSVDNLLTVKMFAECLQIKIFLFFQCGNKSSKTKSFFI